MPQVELRERADRIMRELKSDAFSVATALQNFFTYSPDNAEVRKRVKLMLLIVRRAIHLFGIAVAVAGFVAR